MRRRFEVGEGELTPEEKKLRPLLDGALLLTGHNNLAGIALASQGHPVAGYLAVKAGERNRGRSLSSESQ